MPTPMPPKGPATSMPAANPMAKIGVVGLVGLVVGFVAGYGLGRISTGTPVNPLVSSGKGGSYQDGYNAAKKKLEDAHVFPPAPTELKTLSGSVSSVSSDSFVMTTAPLTANPLEDISAPASRTVMVTSDTKIFRQEPKTAAEQQADFAAFQKAVQALKPGEPQPVPPTFFKTIKISLSDLKQGDTVTVSAAENILTAASFTATEVDLAAGPPSGAQPTPGPAPTPAPVGNPTTTK